MKANLELRLALPTTIVISLLLVVSVVFDVWLQKRQAEETLFEQAYILSQEMQSVWDFVSVNQDTINTNGDGTSRVFTAPSSAHRSVRFLPIAPITSFATFQIVRVMQKTRLTRSNREL